MKHDIRQTSYMALPGLKVGVIFNGKSTPAEILECVSVCLDIPVDKIKSKRRYRHVVEARQMAMFLIRKHTVMSLQNIADIFDGRDHTTAIHSINTANNLIETDSRFKQQLLFIENKLGK